MGICGRTPARYEGGQIQRRVGSYFVSEDYLVCTPERGKTAWPWSRLNFREIRRACVESDTADSEKQWYDAETGLALPGVTHWLDGLEPPEGI